jgi:hypothetical protein
MPACPALSSGVAGRSRRMQIWLGFLTGPHPSTTLRSAQDASVYSTPNVLRMSRMCIMLWR